MNKQIYEEASEWLVELRVGDVDAAARARLDAWFRTSPEHIRAFLELSNIWEESAEKEVSSAFSAAELITRARAVATNVVVLDTSTSARHTVPNTTVASAPETAAVTPVGAPFRRGAYRLAASIAFLAVLVGGFAFYRSWVSTYTTGIGEQRTVSLSDGSRIELNARSSLRVRFSKRERGVQLIAGQALFNVAKDPSRPFVVTSDATRVRAVGTQFDVYQKSSSTTVTVLEGRVAVLPASSDAFDTTLPQDRGVPAPAPENNSRQEGTATPSGLAFPGASPGVLLSAGEQVTVTAQQISRPKKADTAAATAWTQRELVFDETPLTDVANEFNRYNEKPLIVSDALLKDFHVTGVFSSTNPASLLKFLRSQKGIRVQETDQGILIARQ